MPDHGNQPVARSLCLRIERIMQTNQTGALKSAIFFGWPLDCWSFVAQGAGSSKRTGDRGCDSGLLAVDSIQLNDFNILWRCVVFQLLEVSLAEA
jgi:hypothetical protein